MSKKQKHCCHLAKTISPDTILRGALYFAAEAAKSASCLAPQSTRRAISKAMVSLTQQAHVWARAKTPDEIDWELVRGLLVYDIMPDLLLSSWESSNRLSQRRVLTKTLKQLHTVLALVSSTTERS